MHRWAIAMPVAISSRAILKLAIAMPKPGSMSFVCTWVNNPAVFYNLARVIRGRVNKKPFLDLLAFFSVVTRLLSGTRRMAFFGPERGLESIARRRV